MTAISTYVDVSGGTSAEIAVLTEALNDMSYADIDTILTDNVTVHMFTPSEMIAHHFVIPGGKAAWGFTLSHSRNVYLNKSLNKRQLKYTFLHECGGHMGDADALSYASRNTLGGIMHASASASTWTSGAYVNRASECAADQFPRAFAGYSELAGWYGRQIHSGDYGTYRAQYGGHRGGGPVPPTNPPQSNTMAAASIAGATNIKYTGGTWHVGDYLLIDTSTDQEYRSILTAGTSGSGGTGLTLDSALVLAHSNGSALKEANPPPDVGGATPPSLFQTASWTVLDLIRQVRKVLRPLNGGTGNQNGWGRGVMYHGYNATGDTIAIHTLVKTAAKVGNMVTPTTTLNETDVLGVLVGYINGFGNLVEEDCPDQYDAAVLMIGVTDVLVDSTIAAGDYAFASGTDGLAYSDSSAGAGMLGQFLSGGKSGITAVVNLYGPGLPAGGGGGGGGAPVGAKYIVQTPDGTLTNEQALSALATGIMKSTTTTGVVSIAAQGTDYYAPGGTDVAVVDGGTGSSTAAGARTNLGLGTMAVQDAATVAITGGSVTGITIADGGTGSSTAAGARTNLGLGSLATASSLAHASTTGIGPDDHHARQHSTVSTSDHTFPGGTSTFLRADGSWASPAASGAGGSAKGWVGDGSDGNIVLDGTNTYSFLTKTGNVYQQNRDIFANNLTIDSGKTLQTSQFRTYVLGTLTVNGTLTAAGTDAGGISAATAGQAPATVGSPTLGGGQDGGAGRTNSAGVGTSTANSPTSTAGGRGGSGGSATSAGGTAGTVGPTAGATNWRSLPWAVMGTMSPTTAVSGFTLLKGGTGGGSGASNSSTTTVSGGGGGGAGVMIVCATTIIVGASGVITAAGGAGATATGTGAAGGGGGGGGGAMVLLYEAYTNSGSVTVAGGAHGNGVNGGSNGVDGSSGTILLFAMA